jgi:starch-binding outer membrane protein, SusD/RagB family
MRRPLLGGAAGALAYAAVAAGLAACSPDKLLDVTDPDIVNPAVLQSPAGADALRLGAILQLSKATGGNDQIDVNTSNIDSMTLLSGLLADEYRSGDTFVERDETDRRTVRPANANVDGAYRALQRARANAQLAAQAVAEFNPDAEPWHVPQMYWVEAYAELLLAEYFCGAVPVSEATLDGEITNTAGLATQPLLERAVAHADTGLARLGAASGADADRVRSALRLARGRALLDLDRAADAAAAVQGVPTDFAYDLFFNQTAIFNQVWDFVNNQGRYTVSAGDGRNGIDFAGARDPRLPVCRGGDAACRSAGVSRTTIFDTANNAVLPFWVQLKFPARDTPFPPANGVEARLIEAEAQLRANGPWLATLNALRTRVTGLAPLADPGTPAARQDLLFRERALWLFGTGKVTSVPYSPPFTNAPVG